MRRTLLTLRTEEELSFAEKYIHRACEQTINL